MAEQKNLHIITTPEVYDAPIGETRSTARLGRKWLDVEPGEKIRITIGPSDTERNDVGTGLVTAVEYLSFCNLQDRHIYSNHSRKSRADFHALKAAMNRAYGEQFGMFRNVVILFYKRLT